MSNLTSIRGRADQIEKLLRRKGLDKPKESKKPSVWESWPRPLLMEFAHWPRNEDYSEEIRAQLIRMDLDPSEPFPLRNWIPEERYVKEHPEEERSKQLLKEWGLDGTV